METGQEVSLLILVLLVLVCGALGYYTFSLSQELSFKDIRLENKNAEIAQLKTDIAGRDSQIAALKASAVSLSTELDTLQGQVATLAADNQAVLDENQALDARMLDLNEQIDATIEDLQGYEASIAESMQWFQENSDLAGAPDYAKFRVGIRSSCIEKDEVSCRIKLACINLVNQYLEEFSYKPDAVSTDKDDYLLDLAAIHDNQGGDCEDFSLLFSAELAYAEGYCAADGLPVRYQAYVSGTQRYYVDWTEKWYMEGAAPYWIPEDHGEHAIVCGTFPGSFDPNNEGSAVGHCLIGFSSEELRSSDDVYPFLQEAYLVEPQLGALVAELATEPAIRFHRGTEVPKGYLIYMVITGKDLYVYDELDGRYQWFGYEDYRERIAGLRAEMESIAGQVYVRTI
ncbi:hypothetical protein JXB02_01755 [Candidatus Woesearchaeota archaeon]|nr:hypothetical protein [Candidatus Woesearchaeota archaeon]